MQRIVTRCGKIVDPRDHNITATRKGENLDTAYTAVPSPKTEVPGELKRMYEEKNIEPLKRYTPLATR
jgi:hypothetical protein